LALTSALSFTRSASTQAGKSVEEIFPRVIDILLATASPQFSNGTTFVVTECPYREVGRSPRECRQNPRLPLGESINCAIF
jgi:hypothetical protein